MSEKYVTSNGIRLAYEEFGDKGNPTIVLVMGLGSQLIAWPLSMCEAFAEEGFGVIRSEPALNSLCGYPTPWMIWPKT